MTDEVKKSGDKAVLRDEQGHFLPGGSPKSPGRPPGPSLKTALKRAAQEPDPADPARTMADKVAAATMWHASKGNSQMARLAFEYLDGKPDNAVQEIDIKSGQVSIDHSLKESIIADPEARRLAADLLEHLHGGVAASGGPSDTRD